MASFSGPNLEIDGLVLCLDAANTNSYPGSGNTWTDMSGNGNDGTLTNGPTFSSDDGGSVVVDGSNDFILTPRVTGTGIASASVSWGIWVNPSSTSGNIMSMSNSNPQTSWNMPPIAASGQKFRAKIWNNSILQSDTYNLNQWYYLVLVFKYASSKSDRGQFFYVNGELVGSQTNINYSASNSSAGNFMFLGQSNPGANNTGMFTGKYSNFHIYNKALTETDVKQNYNALKSRFGV